jgi:DNA-binding response OmpR family regulator
VSRFTKPPILVVDDSLTVRMSLRDALSRDFDVHLAGTRHEAESMLSKTRFALVVLDVHLTDGDSSPLLRRLVSTSFYDTATPVLVLSGAEGIAPRLDALRAGADFVGKPYAPRFIVDRAKDLLGEPHTPQAGSPCRVLIVDDSMTYAHAVASELRKDGHDVVVAGTGADGLAYLSLQQPHRILLDVFLPDMDGIEIARRVRSAGKNRNVPVLMLTGRESTVIRQRATAAGVTDFLSKDVPLSDIRAWVTRPATQTAARAANAPEPARSASPYPSSPGGLFDRVLVASGLSKVLGRSTLELALRRAGTAPDTLTPATLARSLTEIERILVTFLPAPEVRTRMTSITLLAQEGPPSE